MVGTDLVSFVSSHEQSDIASGLVSEELDLSSTTLLPLWRVCLGIKAEQLGSPAT